MRIDKNTEKTYRNIQKVARNMLSFKQLAQDWQSCFDFCRRERPDKRFSSAIHLSYGAEETA